jgi:hypothetical protein
VLKPFSWAPFPARPSITHSSIQEDLTMWKIVVGFVAFAAIALFVIMKAGDKVDMSGEKHGGDTTTHAPEPAPAPAPAK